MIFTFYSYKGGVGRSMALANIAELFYQAGQKVLIIDWDLEAPGLERYFPIDQEDALNQKGLLDTIINYKEQMASNAGVETPLTIENPVDLAIKIYPSKEGNGELRLLTAGKRSGVNFTHYSQAVVSFDWKDFYENWEGERYFEWFRRKLESSADIVLIDSRTGVTEIGGVCTYQMADIVLMFCAPNLQNLHGIQQMATRLISPNLPQLRSGRPLDIIIIPARVDRSDSKPLDIFKKQFLNKFNPLTFPVGLSIEDLWETAISYVPKYAFAELVAIREEREDKLASAETLALEFRKLGDLLRKISEGDKGLLFSLCQKLNIQPNHTKYDEFGHLTELDLTNPKLDFIPPEIGQFKYLKVLALGNTEQTPVERSPLKNLPPTIGNLSQLTKLSIRGTQLNKLPKELNQLVKLQTLDLSKNELSSIPSEIFNLSALQKLSFNENKLKKVPSLIGQLTGLKLLEINSNYLRSLPSEIGQLINLESLNLSNNWLTELPIELSHLTNIKNLDLNENRLTSIPLAVTKLKSIENLYLGHNKITTLPQSIGQMVNLIVLDVNHNQLTAPPDSLCDLYNLVQLDIFDNDLAELPTRIGNLINLKKLDIGNNKLKTLPKEMRQLENLTSLSLYGNQLSEFPLVLTQLTHLKSINLRDNQISELPSQILELKELELLDLHNNPVEHPPLEVVKQGLLAIKNYIFQLESHENENLEHLYEANLFIIGEAGAGKTTLASKICNSDSDVSEYTHTTEGIDVTHWEFQHDSNLFRANIWDFGGQEIYHATHQLFFTERALYLLVIDSRIEDTDTSYWLNLVELIGGNSPVIIVQNEKQDRKRVLNERQLRALFPNLTKVLAVNLATNRGLHQIVTEIRSSLLQLPHIGTALPKSWVDIRHILEQDVRNYIQFQEYIKICEQHSIFVAEDQLRLSDYLHDLGVFLHFQDDPLLKKIIILKPHWVTNAVYKVLDNEHVHQNEGTFSTKDLKNIWVEEDPHIHNELIHLMMRFQLCYEIVSKPRTYLAPQLLNSNPPQYKWNDVENLTLRYIYEFMPKGIIARFIVSMHHLISSRELIWRWGVVLSNNEAKGEIIEDYARKEIRIRVSGQNKRDFLTIISHELDKINLGFKRIKCDKLIPCNCATCKNSQIPHFYRLDMLRTRLSHGKNTIECDQPPFHLVEINTLIGDAGLFEPALPNINDKPRINISDLTRKIRNYFNANELQTLCLQLNIEYEDLAGNTLDNKSLELIEYCARRDRTNELIFLLQQERPLVNWEQPQNIS